MEPILWKRKAPSQAPVSRQLGFTITDHTNHTPETEVTEVAFLNKALKAAISQGASYVHIEPADDSVTVRPKSPAPPLSVASALPKSYRAAMTRISVVAAIVRKENRVLLGRRPDHKRHGGLWEFPGGKVDEGETEVEAVTRELVEEFGVETVSVGKVVYECRDPGSPFLVRFLDVVIRGKPDPTEHTEMNWFEPDSLVTVRLAPCDASFVTDYLLRVPD